MTREEQIKEASIAFTEANCPRAIGGDYFKDLIAPFNINQDFIEGAKWADKTMLQEVLEWLNKNFFTGDIEGYYSDVPEHIVQGKFDCKEEMIQAFKERFNIE